jgi:hypothetical protein
MKELTEEQKRATAHKMIGDTINELHAMHNYSAEMLSSLLLAMTMDIMINRMGIVEAQILLGEAISVFGKRYIKGGKPTFNLDKPLDNA